MIMNHNNFPSLAGPEQLISRRPLEGTNTADVIDGVPIDVRKEASIGGICLTDQPRRRRR
jgi:hypothetical protein